MLSTTSVRQSICRSQQFTKFGIKRALSSLSSIASSRITFGIRSNEGIQYRPTLRTPRYNTQLVLNYVRYNSITASTDGSDIPESVRNLKIEEYHAEADRTLELIYCALDEFFADNDLAQAEVEENAGILEINFPDGAYVLNKQPPNKQLWLSSPVSGPRRFDFVDNSEWISLRDNVKLHDVLQQEIYDFVKSQNPDLEFSFQESF